jgi:hypothetical protein
VALGALFVVVYLLLLNPIKKQAVTAFKELPGKVAQRNPPQVLSTAGVPAASEAAAPASEGQRANQLKKMLTDKVKAEPAAASRLVESWVREEK